MVQQKKDPLPDEPYRRLVERAAEEVSLRQVLRDAGVIEREVMISQWLNGRCDRNGVRYFPPLKAETRDRLIAYLKARYPKEVAEIEDAPRMALLEEVSKIATRVRTPTELDRFAEYVRNGAIITMVTAHSVTAEGGESTRTYEPREGLTEEVYHRLASDDLLFETQESLAWSVIENLLRKKGLTGVQIGQARRLVPEGVITAMVNRKSFEVVAVALFNEATKTPRKKRL